MSTLSLQILLLILVANGAPILARNILKHKFAIAIDAGRKLYDKRPVFGSSKTWRGLASSMLATSLVALVIGLPLTVGLVVSISAMTGDLIASFVKRRLGLAESSMALLLDQIPESLFPALLLMQVMPIEVQDVTFIVIAFIVLELGLSILLYKAGIRKRPY